MLARVGLLKPIYIRTPLAAGERVLRLEHVVHRRGGGTPKERRRRLWAASDKPLMGCQNKRRLLVYWRLRSRWFRMRGRYMGCQPAVLELCPELTLEGMTLLPLRLLAYGPLALLWVLRRFDGSLASLLRPAPEVIIFGTCYLILVATDVWVLRRRYRRLVRTLCSALDGEVLPDPPESRPPMSPDRKC